MGLQFLCLTHCIEIGPYFQRMTFWFWNTSKFWFRPIFIKRTNLQKSSTGKSALHSPTVLSVVRSATKGRLHRLVLTPSKLAMWLVGLDLFNDYTCPSGHISHRTHVNVSQNCCHPLNTGYMRIPSKGTENMQMKCSSYLNFYVVLVKLLL